MNSFVKKNIITSISSSNVLPYQSLENVGIAENQIINETVNDSFYKLIDNDLFVERQLNDRINYNVGPAYYDYKTLEEADQGFKLWSQNLSSGSTDISILNKYEYPVSATIQPTNLIGKKINFIANIGPLLVGTDSGLYTQLSTETLSSWTNAFTGQLSIGNVIDYYSDSQYFIIAADTGVYSLTNYREIHTVFTPTTIFDFEQISQLSANSIVLLNQGNDPRVILAGSTGLSSGVLKSSGIVDIEEYILSDYTSITGFTDVIAHNDKLYSTNFSTIYKTISLFSLKNAQQVEHDPEVVVNKIFKYDTNVLVQTNQGLFQLVGTNLNRLTDEHTSVVNYTVYQNYLYVLFESGKIYRISNDLDDIQLIVQIPGAIDIQSIDSAVFIATPSSLHYFSYTGATDQHIVSVNLPNDSVKSLVVNAGSIYVYCNSGKLYQVKWTTTPVITPTVEDQYFAGKKINKVVQLDNQVFYLTDHGICSNDRSTTYLPEYNIIDLTKYGTRLFSIVQTSAEVIVDDEEVIETVHYAAVNDLTGIQGFSILSGFQCNSIFIDNGKLFIGNENSLKYIDLNSISEFTDLEQLSNYTEIDQLGGDINTIYTTDDTLYAQYDSFLSEYTKKNFVQLATVDYPASPDENEPLWCLSAFADTFIKYISQNDCYEKTISADDLVEDVYQTQTLVFDADDTLYLKLSNDSSDISSKHAMLGINYDTTDPELSDYVQLECGGRCSFTKYQKLSSSGVEYEYDNLILDETLSILTLAGDSSDSPQASAFQINDNVLKYIDTPTQALSTCSIVDVSTPSTSKLVCKPGHLIDGESSFQTHSDVIQLINCIDDNYADKTDPESTYDLLICKNNDICCAQLEKSTSPIGPSEIFEMSDVEYEGTTYTLSGYVCPYGYQYHVEQLANISGKTSNEDIIASTKVNVVKGSDPLHQTQVLMFMTAHHFIVYVGNSTSKTEFAVDSNYVDLPLPEELSAFSAESTMKARAQNETDFVVNIASDNIFYVLTFSIADDGIVLSDITSYSLDNPLKITSYYSSVYAINGGLQTLPINGLNTIELINDYDAASSRTTENVSLLKVVNNSGLVWTTSPESDIYDLRNDRQLPLKSNDIYNITFANGRYYMFGETGMSSNTQLTLEMARSFESVNTYRVYDVAFSSDNQEEYWLSNGVFSDKTDYENSYQVNYDATATSPVSLDKTTYVDSDEKTYVTVYGSVLSTINVLVDDTDMTIEVAPCQYLDFGNIKFKSDDMVMTEENTLYYKDDNGKYHQTIVPFKVESNINKYVLASTGNLPFEIFQFEAGKLVDYLSPIIDNISCYSLYDIGDENTYFSNPFGLNTLYYVDDRSTIKYYDPANSIQLFTPSTSTQFICIGDTLNEIDKELQKKSVKYILTQPALNCMYNKSKYEYLLGTAAGLNFTKYTFDTTDDLSLSSRKELEEIFNDHYDNMLSNHIENWHGENDVLTKINTQLMPVDCVGDMFDTNKSIDNIVEFVEFSGSRQYTSAKVEFTSELSVYNQDDLDVSYIFKKYKNSRQGELYLYVPTTNTYYLNHLDELHEDDLSIKDLTRQNTKLNLTRSVVDNTTYLSVFIDKLHFMVDHIYFSQINGNSLPLKIYSDDENSDLFQNTGFSTILKQTAQTDLDYSEENDKIVLKYICFGTNSQAIHLKFNFFINYFIEYHGNDADDGEMPIQECRSSNKLTLLNCEFVKNGYTFAGWSTNKYAIEPQFTNCQEVTNLTDVEGKTVTLYAIWRLHTFSNNSTILKISTDVDPITLSRGEKLLSATNVVVDYDYSPDMSIKLKSNGLSAGISEGHGRATDSNITINFDSKD